ncbi:MAG: PAS domain S-box protein, partial [bacterium]
LQLQMEAMPIACVLSDPESRVTYWNPAAQRTFGYSFEEVEAKSYRELLFREASAKIGALDSWVDGESHERVGKNIRKDGKSINCEWYDRPLRDAGGSLLGVMSMAIDVTERQKAGEVQAQLAAILQQTTDAVYGTDLEHQVFNWNRGAEVLFGYGLGEIMGKTVSVLAPSDRLNEMKVIRAAALEGKNISNHETVRVKKNGERVDVSVSLSQIKDAQGKVVGVSTIARDITERKKAEESLRRHEEQMRLAQKMDAIGRLAGGVAHDFNNLLSVIGGNTEFLLSDLAPDDTRREEAEEIQKAVRRGAELTKQLLVFGQKQVSKPEPVNLNELSSEMNKMLKRLIDATINLSIIQDRELKPIRADSGQMQQIILNLVLNARDAMPEGGDLTIETKNIRAGDLADEHRASLTPGDYVRLIVVDTGSGMEPEVQKRIFEPFFTTKAEKGTGLGLATVYSIVQKWNGNIFVESALGVGTRFILYFPVLTGAEAKAVPDKPADIVPKGFETILLAEDEAPVRKILVRTLERYGYRVLEAANGLEAVQKAWSYSGTIHLLLTDTIMPKLNGKQLADELLKTRPQMKVIFVSGYTREVLSEQGILVPGIHLIQKPFELEELASEIRKVLDGK